VNEDFAQITCARSGDFRFCHRGNTISREGWLQCGKKGGSLTDSRHLLPLVPLLHCATGGEGKWGSRVCCARVPLIK
jgi:hypothetical protein